MLRILYIDDEPDLLELGKLFLERSSEIKVDEALSASIGLSMMERSNYDAIISDYQMPEMNGIDFLKMLRSRGDDIPFILFTGRGREELVIEALNSGANFYLQKGGNPMAQFAELEHKVKEAVRRSRAEENLNKNEQRLKKAHVLGRTGCWEYDWTASPDMLWGSEEGFQIFGLNIPSGEIHIGEIEACIPERERVHQALTDLIRRGKKYDLVYEIRPADGSPSRIINSIAELERDRTGTPIKAVGLIKDITDSRRVEENLRRDEACNRVLFELTQMPGPTPKDIAEKAMDHCIELSHSKIGYIAFLNEDETVLTMQHYSKEAMERCAIEKKPMVFDIGTTGLWAEAVRQRHAVVTNDYSAPNQLKKGLPPGHVPLTRHMSVPVFDRGRIVAVAGVGNKETVYDEQDVQTMSHLMDGMWRIVRKIEAEAEVKESEERFRTLSDASFEGIIIHRDGIILDVNKAALELTGYGREEAIGKPIIAFLPADSVEKIKRAIMMPSVEAYEASLIKRDGSPLAVQIKARTFDYHGKEARVATIMDITERKRAEEALKASQLQLTIAMEAAKLVSWEYDLAGQMYTFNDRFYAMYGTSAELEGGYQMPLADYWSKFVHPEDLAYVKEVYASAPNYQGNGLHLEHRMIRRDGEARNIASYPCQIKDDEGRVIKVFGLNQDVTDRRRAEDALRKANEKLGLLSGVTRHDIKNQLMIQRGFLELIKGRTGNPEIEARVQKIDDSVKVVQKQIEFTKDYEMMGVSAPLWQSVHRLLENLPDLKGIELLEVSESVRRLEVCADPMLDKVFHNLFENSIRYSGKPAHISIDCVNTGNGCLLIVEDDGAGIPTENKERIFQKGFGKGTGLGLFLSRDILALTGIAIAETGQPGKGARFELRIPRGQFRFDQA